MFAEIPINKLETTILSKIFFLGLIEKKDEKLYLVRGMIEKTREVFETLEQYNQELGKLVLELEALYKEIEDGSMLSSTRYRNNTIPHNNKSS